MDAERQLTCTVRQAAELLGIGYRRALRSCREGAIPCLVFGSTMRVPLGPLQRMLGHSLGNTMASGSHDAGQEPSKESSNGK